MWSTRGETLKLLPPGDSSPPPPKASMTLTKMLTLHLQNPWVTEAVSIFYIQSALCRQVKLGEDETGCSRVCDF